MQKADFIILAIHLTAMDILLFAYKRFQDCFIKSQRQVL